MFILDKLSISTQAIWYKIVCVYTTKLIWLPIVTAFELTQTNEARIFTIVIDKFDLNQYNNDYLQNKFYFIGIFCLFSCAI